MTKVTLKNIVKKYGKLEVVHGINIDIEHNEFIVLVGPSGCGKSTTLRMVAGLEDITSGEIKIGDKVVNELAPRDRNISMIFQNYALYPHMSVRENLGFGLKIAKHSEAVITERVAEAAEMLGIADLLERRPAELSGGQRQRVAMGRAIVRNPDVFLFDEPLSNLDAKLRVQMRTEIKKLHKRVKNTIIYVTHDQVEAMTLADRIVIMRDGNIEQVGTPLYVFNFPTNVFVASFIGSPPMNLIEATVEIKNGKRGSLLFPDNIIIPVPERLKNAVKHNQKVVVGIRADDLTPVNHGIDDESEKADLNLTVHISEPLGTETILFCSIGGQEIQCKMLNPYPVTADEKMTFKLAIDKIHLFDFESGNNLLGTQDG
ncbi:MAG: sn-glycerol-3-phosphate ABC transporter ATP-binding protein UgpC [Rhizobiales bacterium]|nr:sn-glycerol-3-phosphate ABC transporter ATP-binding protein UgpC [Hyphomicrobiales bacterium]